MTGKDTFLGPWSGKSFADWDDATRQRELEVLACLLEIEVKAIAEIEQSLALLT